MKCPRCNSDKASAAPMERGFQILCPCGYSDSVASIAAVPVEQQPSPPEPEPPREPVEISEPNVPLDDTEDEDI